MTFNYVWFTTSCVRQQLYRFNLQQKNRRARHEANTKREEVLLSTKWNIWYPKCLYLWTATASNTKGVKNCNFSQELQLICNKTLSILIWTVHSFVDAICSPFFFFVSETRRCHSLRVGKWPQDKTSTVDRHRMELMVAFMDSWHVGGVF